MDRTVEGDERPDPTNGRCDSPAVRRACHLAKTMLSVRGEADATRLSTALVAALERFEDSEADAFFRFLADECGPDPAAVSAAIEGYRERADLRGLLRLQEAVAPPRQELFRRMNRAAGGTAAVVRLRARLLSRGIDRLEFRAVDADLRHLLASWFNPGFLELRRIEWSAPASLLEKLIEHEAVHAIAGWDDLRRRLQPDRRCFAFFHPQLPGEPLIFVEVALVPEIAAAIGPLVDATAPLCGGREFRAAVFYSISNCQPGLKGISIGTFLIKQVIDAVQAELPALERFATLSPLPGFNAWLDTAGDPRLTHGGEAWGTVVRDGWRPAAATARQRTALLECADRYLSLAATPAGDPVARFHLSNGASLHRINWNADDSSKGIRQSSGVMVNYLYEPQRLETNHEAFANGVVMRSGPCASSGNSA